MHVMITKKKTKQNKRERLQTCVYKRNQNKTNKLCLQNKTDTVCFCKQNNQKAVSLQTRYFQKTKLNIKFTDRLCLQNRRFTDTLCLQNKTKGSVYRHCKFTDTASLQTQQFTYTLTNENKTKEMNE